MGTRLTPAKVDRLPRRVQRDAYYLNIDASRQPRDPEKARADQVPTIIYDGSNDVELAELLGECDEECRVVIISHRDLDHVDPDTGEEAMGLELEDAYTFDGQRWNPTPELVQAVRALAVEETWERNVQVVADV